MKLEITISNDRLERFCLIICLEYDNNGSYTIYFNISLPKLYNLDCIYHNHYLLFNSKKYVYNYNCTKKVIGIMLHKILHNIIVRDFLVPGHSYNNKWEITDINYKLVIGFLQTYLGDLPPR